MVEVIRRFDLQLFADGDGDKPNDADTSGGQQDGKGDQPFAVFPDEASFTSRLKREGRKQLEERAKALGFESVEAMETALKEFQARAEQEKSDLEKAQAAAAAATADRDRIQASVNDRLIQAEVKVLAVELGFVDPDAALALMDRSGVEVTEAGEVRGVKESLEDLLKAKPYLKRPADGKTGNYGPTNPPPGDKETKNPWKRETFNLTEQGRILREDPDLARRLQQAAKSG